MNHHDPAYREALHTIFGRVNFERQPRFDYSATTLNLERMRVLLAELGNPQQYFHIVHVAGTKGKGSVCAFTESILRAGGYRTGLYTSPHLHTFRERLRVHGALIGRAELAALVAHCRPALERIAGVTTFELITALALTHFAQQGVQWAVLEVGLGGRLDATNVVRPDITAITSLSFDHMAVLGDTLAQIAAEKAGIIKPGVPLICAPQAPEALAVIESVCHERQAPLVLLERDTTAAVAGFNISLAGAHQAVNAALAVVMARMLRGQGLALTEAAMADGLAQTRWPARFETLAGGGDGRAAWPMVVVDGAHNVDSAQKLAALLVDAKRARGGRLALILGASLDKDVAGMLRVLLPAADQLICTQAQHPRAFAPQALAALAAEQQGGDAIRLLAAATVDEALILALETARPVDLVCFAGSLFIAAEGREAWARRHPEHFAAGDWVFEAEPLEL